MLDKSLAYHPMVMRLDGEQVARIGEPVLPNGFAFRFFRPGDELNWASVTTSVLEFDDENSALEYFAKSFLPHPDLLQKRCLFIVDRSGEAVGTAMAWHIESGHHHWACLHWVAVRPQFQRMGLGRAVVAKALQRFAELDAGENVWLHTQTWSHRAVRLYHSMGFYLMRSESLPSLSGGPVDKNEFGPAMATRREVLPPAEWKDLMETAR